MKPAQSSGVMLAARSGATRRALLGAGAAVGVGAVLAGLHELAVAAAPVAGALIDVLDRPASAARIAAASPMLRVARCGRRLVAVGERGVVLFSDDDGQRWQQAQVPVSVTLTGVQFTSDRRGYAIGHGGVVLRSDDAGQTWKRLLDGRRIPALLSPPELAKQAEQEGPDKPWLALHFIDDMNGMVVGAFGMALETADGGQTWRSFAERLANPRALHLYAVHRRADRVWVAGEQGLYVLSADGGRSYSAQPTPYRGSFFALRLLDDERALLGGLRGTLLLHDGGDQFRTLTPASTQSVVQLLGLQSETAAHSLALVDQSGRTFTASLPDLQFKPLAMTPARTWLAVAQAADGALVGASFDGVSRLQPALSQPKT
jgi:photosystem II stability/assembly factor-like uncharacterized protein